MKQNQVKWGAMLSYILIILNTLYGLFVTPYILGCIGESEYGVYKTISSLTSAMMVLDLGMGGTVMRYVAKFRADKEDGKIPNFVAMNLVQAAILCGVIGIAATGVFVSIEGTYAATFTPAQIDKAQMLFIVLIVNVMFHVLENVMNGVITGHNNFMFGNGIKVLRLLIRIACTVILLKFFTDSLTIVLIDLALTMMFLLVEFLHVRRKLGIRIKLTKWEKTLFMESGKYTALMFLTSIAAQVNNNLDNVIIGALSGPAFVTVYSFGLLIFGMFEQLSTAISGVMLPTVTNLLAKEEGMGEVENLVVRAGRIQFMLLGAAFVGFFCVGQDFVKVWLGNGYEDVYIITLILMGPALLELCVNVCLSILRAQNRLTFRTLTLFGSTLLNAIVTYFAVKHWSYIGAAFGTAASFIIGSLVVMNIYYKVKLKLPILKIYGRILSRTWVCLLLAGGCLYLLQMVYSGTVLSLIVGTGTFMVVYGLSLYFYGFNPDEKKHIRFGGKKND